MGIDGLLRHLKECNKEKNLEEYRGMRAAVDTYSWLDFCYLGYINLSKVQMERK